MEENKEGTQQAAQEAYVRQLAELSARVLHMTEEQKQRNAAKIERIINDRHKEVGGTDNARAVCSKAAFVGAAGCAGAAAARC